jgi:hypothetical protein
LPHDEQVILLASAGGAAARAASEVPHILQKFMPGGLTVPQAVQTPLAPLAAPAETCGAGALGSSLCPQSWQNSEPSRFTFPQ